MGELFSIGWTISIWFCVGPEYFGSGRVRGLQFGVVESAVQAEFI